MEKERFSLLLLEPGEIYFEDFSVEMLKPSQSYTGTEDTDCLGHLKMCSKSVVFDPKNKSQPLIKIPYKDSIEFYQSNDSLFGKNSNVLGVKCNQSIEVLDGNIIGPYKFVNSKSVFLFKMHYAKVSEYLPQICQLHRASSLHACEQNSMIATIVYSRQQRVKFDPLWLEDISEKVLLSYQIDEIKPLVINPGKVLLTNANIYFRPFNNLSAHPVQIIKLSAIKTIQKRRYLLRQIGLEIIWLSSSRIESLYISFRNQLDRDTFFGQVMTTEDINVSIAVPESMTLRWQNGLITNYEYLLYLNSLADRSFQDLTQYPVFPWIIKDYTSDTLDLNDQSIYRDLTKPIGALNIERLNRLHERCDEMSDPKFLYGSHYSAPGLVLFYLVRRFPDLMLCLQNGRFHHPDRMFNSIGDTFNNCLNNMSDFKELIPEFYDVSQKGDFLINNLKIDFGKRHDGTQVNNVNLPPWANESPEVFITKLNEALESDFVSQNLNHWIDLMFGYKQRGEEALKANNLFFHLCYEGSVDLENVKELSARHALEVQISEFGQIPRQLFHTPHVSKIMTKSRDLQTKISAEKITSNVFDIEIRASSCNLDLVAEFTSHKESITCLSISNETIISCSKDGSFKCYDAGLKCQIRNIVLGTSPLSSCAQITNSKNIILGSWDNSITVYNLDYGKTVCSMQYAHDDAVSCLSYIEKLDLLFSGSWDCSVKIWKGFDCSGSSTLRTSNSLVCYLAVDEKVTGLDTFVADKTIKCLISLSSGEIFLWTTDATSIEDAQNCVPKLFFHCRDTCFDVKFNKTGIKVAICCFDGSLSVIDLHTEMVVLNVTVQNSFTSLTWLSDEYLCVGDDGGSLSFWNMISGKREKESQTHNGMITRVQASGRFVATSSSNGYENRVKIWNI